MRQLANNNLAYSKVSPGVIDTSKNLERDIDERAMQMENLLGLPRELHYVPYDKSEL